ncbi:hypothetical protein CARUB_v10024982mg [Capsella rubella]|uniref:Protein kinase domain-containing protein n=1 Tax=Capsella rubella TaxID=81985 RepID=R0G0N9_9BRAS|nr:hypothetical protein CARUB_v10024982mg [Capsella rubella]
METRSLSDSMIRDFTHCYVHCDLKPENILISDFGMATKVGEDSEFWEYDSPYLGTSLNMSPESVQNGIVEEALDLWSLGCIVLEMYTGEPPWPLEDSMNILPLLLNGNAPEIPESIPWEARQFLQTCFAKSVVVFKTKQFSKKVLKVKIIPPKPPQFKKISNRPMRLKIISPKPPGFSLVPVQ